MMRLFLGVVSLFSCLLSGAAFFFLQKIGWKSDGPGALCPMIIFAGAGFVGVLTGFHALTTPPSEPPIN